MVQNNTGRVQSPDGQPDVHFNKGEMFTLGAWKMKCWHKGQVYFHTDALISDLYQCWEQASTVISATGHHTKCDAPPPPLDSLAHTPLLTNNKCTSRQSYSGCRRKKYIAVRHIMRISPHQTFSITGLLFKLIDQKQSRLNCIRKQCQHEPPLTVSVTLSITHRSGTLD